jgi:hypothetical protein
MTITPYINHVTNLSYGQPTIRNNTSNNGINITKVTVTTSSRQGTMRQIFCFNKWLDKDNPVL